MNEIQRAGFLAHAQTQRFKRRVTQAIATIEQWIAAADGRVYGAISGGKDSLAMCGLIQQVQPGTPFVWVNQGPLGEWDSCVESLSRLRSDRNWNIVELCPPRSLWNLYLDHGVPVGASMTSALDRLINRKLIYDPIDEWLESNPCNGCAVGLRKESKGRMLGIHKHGTLFQNKQGQWVCWPLGHWSVDDIWAYILSAELPYASLYDPDPRHIRNGPPIGTTGANRGRLTHLRINHPDYWEALVRQFPDLATFC